MEAYNPRSFTIHVDQGKCFYFGTCGLKELKQLFGKTMHVYVDRKESKICVTPLKGDTNELSNIGLATSKFEHLNENLETDTTFIVGFSFLDIKKSEATALAKQSQVALYLETNNSKDPHFIIIKCTLIYKQKQEEVAALIKEKLRSLNHERNVSSLCFTLDSSIAEFVSKYKRKQLIDRMKASNPEVDVFTLGNPHRIEFSPLSLQADLKQAAIECNAFLDANINKEVVKVKGCTEMYFNQSTFSKIANQYGVHLCFNGPSTYNVQCWTPG
eukprot:gene7432-9781_t